MIIFYPTRLLFVWGTCVQTRWDMEGWLRPNMHLWKCHLWLLQMCQLVRCFPIVTQNVVHKLFV